MVFLDSNHNILREWKTFCFFKMGLLACPGSQNTFSFDFFPSHCFDLGSKKIPNHNQLNNNNNNKHNLRKNAGDFEKRPAAWKSTSQGLGLGNNIYHWMQELLALGDKKQWLDSRTE